MSTAYQTRVSQPTAAAVPAARRLAPAGGRALGHVQFLAAVAGRLLGFAFFLLATALLFRQSSRAFLLALAFLVLGAAPGLFGLGALFRFAAGAFLRLATRFLFRLAQRALLGGLAFLFFALLPRGLGRFLARLFLGFTLGARFLEDPTRFFFRIYCHLP